MKLFLLLPLFLNFANAKETEYGAPITLKDKQALTTVVNENARFKDQDVLVEASLKQVCQKKGCWAVLSQDGTEVRMTFKDYGFFIPKDSASRLVLAQGRIIEKTLSEKQRRHYLEDAGAPASEIEKIKGSKLEKSFVASGLKYLN